MIKILWRRLFGDPDPLSCIEIEYCDICHNREVLPGTHLCTGPMKCGICHEEIIFVDPYGAFSKHPCFEK